MSIMSVKGPLLWSRLSYTQRVQGIHPEQFGAIKFDFQNNELPFNDIKKFFLHSRLATSDFDFFLSKSVRHIRSAELSRSMRIIAIQTLLLPRPKEVPIKKDDDGDYNIPLKDDGSTNHRTYIKKFATVYNLLVKQEMGFLLHPARRKELIEDLRPIFPDVALAADRLITYRCFGNQALKISELKRELKAARKKFDEIQLQISSSLKKINLIENPMDLQDDHLACIPDEHIRKYVCMAYQTLASKGILEILDLPDHEIYVYRGGTQGDAHPALAHLATKYYQDIFPPYHFGRVVRYLRHLKHNDLNDLLLFCLNQELFRLSSQIYFTRDDIRKARNTYKNQLQLLSKKAEDFKPGDFSFLTETLTIRLLTNAFNAIEKLQEWSFFDMEPPENCGYMFWDHPAINKIGEELKSDGHTGSTMGFTMRWMQRIRQKGWDVSVRESLENNAKELGVFSLITAHSKLDKE